MQWILVRSGLEEHLPNKQKGQAAADAVALFLIKEKHNRSWRSWITQQIPILKNGGSNPSGRAKKEKSHDSVAFLFCIIQYSLFNIH